MKDDITAFSANEETNVRSISAKIQHETYAFSPAKGVALEKPNKPGSIRPIVIPRATDRVVQRCILDALVSSPKIREDAFQPTSFGGIPKQHEAKFAGVPAAIEAVLAAIEAGGTHVIIADIASFFSRIRKSDAAKKISDYTDDLRFIELFKNAIDIDLSNHEEIWKYKNAFPYGDIGVGQGVCLSPFLGNIILSDFDRDMNIGDCVCLRYVDDIIIIAPSGKAASARFRKAQRLLGELGMEFAEEKTSPTPVEVTQKFEYLGIEFNNGLLRPSQKSRKSIERRSADVAAKSLQVIRSTRIVKEFNTDYSIPKTLSKISGMSRGWANHYRFCNDLETIRNTDRKIASLYLDYTSKATALAQKELENNKPDLAAAYLGYQGMQSIDFSPFAWQPQSS